MHMKSTTLCYVISVLLLALTVWAHAAAAGDPQLKQQEILFMAQEMRRANYFTFVTLINLVEDKLPSNTTFLMPNDRMLSKAMIQEDQVLEFLSRHSIPSPLLFDDLKHFPTGTMLPSYLPNYMLNITNDGRKSFYFNNAQLMSPNICTSGSLFRCHGINGVLEAANKTCTTTSPNCSHSVISPPPPTGALPPSPSPPQSSPGTSYTSPPSSATPPVMYPSASPGPAESKNSSSCTKSGRRLLDAVCSCIVLSMLTLLPI